MFGQIFNPENGFFRMVDKVADFLGLSVLCLLCSLPLFTLGPAVAALYYSTVKCLRRGERHPYGSFFTAFKQNFRTGAVLSLILLPVLVLLVCGYNVLVGAVNAGAAWAAGMLAAYVVAAVLPLSIFFLMFPLISRFTYGVGGALKAAFQMTVRHLPVMVVLVVLNGGILLLTARYALLLLPLLVAPGLGALLSSFLLEPVFKKYTPAAEDVDPENRPWYLK